VGGSGGRSAPLVRAAPAGGPAVRVDLGAGQAGAERADPAGPADEEVLELSTTDPADRAALRSPPPERTIRVDGRFTYRTDGLGRVVRATATLGTVDLEHPRDGGAQRRLVGKLPGDHAGHIFARIFQGPSGTLNLVPMQSAKVNQGLYRSLENRWRKMIEGGGTVDVVVEFDYPTGGPRPHTIRVGHTNRGAIIWTSIDNAPGDIA
jgi:DNA/RNA non-specific endonuclease